MDVITRPADNQYCPGCPATIHSEPIADATDVLDIATVEMGLALNMVNNVNVW